MLKNSPIIQKLVKGDARVRSGVILLGWGFSATMSLLIAVSAYQNRTPDPFAQQYAALALPDAVDVDTTASIGNGGRRPTEFSVFSDPAPVASTRPGRFEAEIETLRHEIVALRRSAESLRRQNDIMSDRLAMIEGGGNAAPRQVPSYPAPTRYAANTRQQASDPLITGSIRKQSKTATAAPSVPRSKFGIDLGAYASLEEVARAWRAMQATEERVVGNLLPIASIVQDGQQKMVAHLVAGPFDNAADAAATCARLEKRLIDCKPTLFAGQPLPAR